MVNQGIEEPCPSKNSLPRKRIGLRFPGKVVFVGITIFSRVKLSGKHVADARTCVLHPASHTHRQLSDEQLREAGVAPDLIRLSVGIENVEDIIEDIQQALDASK